MLAKQVQNRRRTQNRPITQRAYDANDMLKSMAEDKENFRATSVTGLDG